MKLAGGGSGLLLETPRLCKLLHDRLHALDGAELNVILYVAADAYEAFQLSGYIDEKMHEAFLLAVDVAKDGRELVAQMLDEMDAEIDRAIDNSLGKQEKDFLSAHVGDHQFSQLYLLDCPDPRDHRQLRAVGFLGAMVTVFDNDGRSYTVDQSPRLRFRCAPYHSFIQRPQNKVP